MQVKICGIRSLEDAQAAIQAGADLLGFNFYPASPRYIEPKTCQEIVSALRQQPVSVILVGVFVNAASEQILETLERCSLDLAQLHGNEPPEVLKNLGQRAYKALRPVDLWALEDALERYPARFTPPAWLVDAHNPVAFGGTGQTSDWTLAAELAETAPILLAGGLTPDNVIQAINQVHPWGVDVASGVESAPGIKDIHKMRTFIKNAKELSKNFKSM